MRGQAAAIFPIALALAATIVAPEASAQAQGAREGLIEIEKCQTISQPGAYKLANNLTASGICLVITADFVTIDLAGFTITGPNPPNGSSSPAIMATANGIAVRNGSISGFGGGINLGGEGSIVEGLGIFGSIPACCTGISAKGIVRGNFVVDFPAL
jgi:hypothetical protein